MEVYPLVNVYSSELEIHHFSSVNQVYFDGAMFSSYVTNYQRLVMEMNSWDAPIDQVG